MSTAAARRPCLLLVDDTPANIQVLVGLLQSDYELKVATRGAAALQVCEQNPQIDLILLDVMMPEMDGYEVCRRLRANPATRSIPVIFLTAKADTDDVVHGFELGASDYVAKPFRPAELCARVKTHLLIRAQQREIEEKNIEMKEMLHLVCHDVANHFGVLGMTLDLAKMKGETKLDWFLPRITTAVRNGIGLTQLIRELRMSEDKGIALHPVALNAALDEALLLAEQKLQAKQLTIVREGPEGDVLAEKSALTNSVLGNILSNAIKFSHAGASIRITSERTDGMVLLKIRDQGVGMPAEIAAQLFDFTKSTSRLGTDGEKGTGFGMPLMRKFVLMFGGEVTVVTRDIAAHPGDHGTEFCLRFRTL